MIALSALILAAFLPGAHSACEWYTPPPARKLLVAPAELSGEASYYASSLEGRRTASGETFRNDLFTAAHRTLPLGAVVLVRAVASGKEVMVRVNDRGPFGGSFVIDLTQAAAGAIAVDTSASRDVEIHVLRLPE
jgi:rare lipoprotein A